MSRSNVALLWQKASDLGTYSGGDWATALPLANLTTQDVRRVARSVDATAAKTRWRVDLGASVPRPVNAFALLNHNGTTAATWRIVVTSNANDTDPAARVLDTGTLPMWLPSVVIGQQPWGAFPWNGIDAAAYPGGALAFHLASGTVLARYIWIYVSDTANPAGYFEAGRFLAGVAWRPRINMAFGAGIRWIDPGEARRTLGGRRLFAGRPRVWRHAARA